MIYAHPSDNNHGCDVYVQWDKHAERYSIHVETHRLLWRPIRNLPGRWLCSGGWMFRVYVLWHDWIRRPSLRFAPRVPIGLPHDGDVFRCELPEQCAERLIYLADTGYRVPPSVIRELYRVDNQEGYDG